MHLRLRPEVDSWVAAIHPATDDRSPLGSGVVIDDRRVLTCAHVVMSDDGGVRDAIWVAFPLADPPSRVRCQVRSVSTPGEGRVDPDQDVALLELADPVPAGVVPARLRCPAPKALVGTNWWAFGFPPDSQRGSASDGEVGAALAQGWIRIDVTSQYHIEPGFSGAGLWSAAYDAVVGIVAEHDQRNGQAITLHEAADSLPGHALRQLAEQSSVADSGAFALAAWGWSLATDPEGRRHWRPRARGVSIDSEHGHRFRGRATALQAIRAWLDRDVLDRRVLLVTGAPGAGKSAVLGRIVTTADKDAVRELPASDTAEHATLGSIACAVHAKGRTALEVAAQIAKAASAPLPELLVDIAPALRAALEEREGRRFNVIVDALDEAATPAEARLIMTKVILPIAQTCADVGAQVVVGSRRSDTDGDLLWPFGDAATLVNLDEQEFFDEQDLADYAHAALQLAGDEREGNPYAADEIAAPVAARIAELSDRNFLVAGMTARTHGLYDEEPVRPTDLGFTPRVEDAVREYLLRIPDVPAITGGSVPAGELLTALAFAESPGLPAELWRVAVKALGFGEVDEALLKRFARSSAASFLVETYSEDGARADYRLFHQALDDALLRARARLMNEREDEQVLTRGFIAAGMDSGWDKAPSYLLRSLPAHAARAGMMDDLLADDDYLLHADLLRVESLADLATTATGHRRESLLHLAPRGIISADAPNRAGMFSVTETLEDLGDSYTKMKARIPYRGAWASAPYSTEKSVLHGHNWSVTSICALVFDGKPLLATASLDRTVGIWDPATGIRRHALEGHKSYVNAVCTFAVDEYPLLASAGHDGTVRLWNPIDGTEGAILNGHTGPVHSICAFSLKDRAIIATFGSDASIRVWTPGATTWDPIIDRCDVVDHNNGGSAICAFTLDDTILLAVGNGNGSGTVGIWRLDTGTQPMTLTQHSVLQGHDGWVYSVCPLIAPDGKPLLVSAGNDATVRIWDPATGTQRSSFRGHDKAVRSVCTFTKEGTTFLATASEDGTARVWDPTAGAEDCPPYMRDNWVQSICSFSTQGGATLLAGGEVFGDIRIWDPAALTRHLPVRGHDGTVDCVYTFTGSDEKTLLATAGGLDGTVRIWEATHGVQHCTLEGQIGLGWAHSFAAFAAPDGLTLLAIGNWDGTVGIWDPSTGTQQSILHGDNGPVHSVHAFTADDTTLLATGNGDGTIGIWDLATGIRQSTLDDHNGTVNSVRAFTANGTTVLATASHDGTVCIWDPSTGTRQATLDGHNGPVNSVHAFTADDTTLLATASDDGTVRVWNPANGTHRVVHDHNGSSISDVCAFTRGGQTYFATAGGARSVCVWDLATGTTGVIVPTRDEVYSVAYADGLLFAGTSTGLVAIKLGPSATLANRIVKGTNCAAAPPPQYIPTIYL